MFPVSVAVTGNVGDGSRQSGVFFAQREGRRSSARPVTAPAPRGSNIPPNLTVTYWRVYWADRETINGCASELAKTIPGAYEATEVRREIFDAVFSLQPERGPLSE